MPATKFEKKQPFRFFDNREKYLLFVNTCSEKWVIADRVGIELDRISPAVPALRLFDAGMGDATVLTLLMRHLHRRFPTVPFLIVGKEISLEDVRLSLEKMADRFLEHPLTVLVVTNLYYSEAPWLRPKKPEAQSDLRWWDIPLEGQTAHEFDAQIRSLQPLLNEGWRTRTSPRTGNPLYVRPSVMVLYRADQRFVLEPVIPRSGGPAGSYDLLIAAQPYRARLPAEKKVDYVLAPLAEALGAGGRMIVVQSTGRDPGMEIIRKIWPDESPFQTPRHVLIDTLKARVQKDHPGLTFDACSDERSLIKYHLHALPDEVASNIGMSTLLAAWNAAVYVAQIDDERLNQALTGGEYLDVIRKVLKRHGGLWFLDETFVVAREKRKTKRSSPTA